MQFAMTLANGDLSNELKARGPIAGALKSLQADMRHITWQAKCIAAGDLSQRVEFMGEFATAFNSMVENMRQSYEALEQQRQAAVDLMAEAQAASQEVEEMNRLLREKLEENKVLQEKLHEQSIRDELTRLYNRYYLDEVLAHEIARSRRENTPMCLLMLDIDQFKHLNDTYGHHAGDIVLQELGALITGRVRRGDVPCRYGGEEFLIVLPNTSIQGGLVCAEGLRIAFEKLSFKEERRTFHVTFSAGLAAFPDDASGEEDLLRAADKALYKAKTAGRNRTAIAGRNWGEFIDMHL